MNRFLSLTAGLALCVMLGACGGSDEPKGPGYTPISDKELFAQIAAIPGVTKVGVHYRDEFGNSNNYVGEVEVDAAVDPAVVLDTTLAILRQGSPGASMTVVAVQDNHQISPRVLGLASTTAADLEERYGPQPGDGKPPETTETPTP